MQRDLVVDLVEVLPPELRLGLVLAEHARPQLIHALFELHLAQRQLLSLCLQLLSFGGVAFTPAHRDVGPRHGRILHHVIRGQLLADF